MKNKIFFWGVCASMLIYVACNTTSRHYGDNYEHQESSSYTGRTILLDDRLFFVADIISFEPPKDKIDGQMIPKGENGRYILVKFRIHNRDIFVHKRMKRYISSAPCLYQMASPKRIEADTVLISVPLQNKKKIARIAKERCLVGVNKNYYLKSKGSLDSDFWGDAEVSLIIPHHFYSLDSLVLYDSIYKMWWSECVNIIDDMK